MPQEAAERRLLDLGGAAVTVRELPLPGGVVRVLEQGAGEAVLLLHGGGGGGANWYRLLPGLAADHRVIAPDLPGFGGSADVVLEPPLGLQSARLLDALLDALGVARATVLGTSFGGLAALRLAQHFPSRVRALVLLDSAGLGRQLPWHLSAAAMPLLGAWLLRPSERGTRWLFRRLLTSGSVEREHEAALVAWLTESARTHQRFLAAALRHFVAGRMQREVLEEAELRALRLPVLLLWGERDLFFPAAHAQAAARLLPRAEVRLIPGAGHSANWERPAHVLLELRRFLAALA